ncbi:AAA family ATPase [Propionibacteriaceae bacterium Y1700]|uniref:AAA family ATPase n=1 Tax=Microlunatus sp. Y1700 TaxID=3418487 RepID=UPI003DA75430
MTSTTDPTPTLSAALTALAEAARTAGVDEQAARAEGESLAATIAEPATGAWQDWTAQVGGGRSTEDFFEAASRGRRWRSAPTALLSELVVGGSGQAKAYAQALSEVCQAATGLGEHSMRAVGNASVASSAQLKSVLPPDPEPEPAPQEPQAEEQPRATGPGGLPAPEPLLRFLNQINTQQIKDQGDRIRDLGSSFLFGRKGDSAPDTSGTAGQRTPAPPPSSANPFDLGTIDPHAPGAFSGLPTPTGAPSGSRPLGEPPAPTTPPAAPSGASDASGATDPSTAHQPAPTQAAPAPAESTPTEPEPEPRSLEELLAELDGLIGLDAVKREIHRQVAVLKVEKLRIKAGLKSPTITRHLIFTGNPGTGKTTVARLVAGIYRALGLLSKGQLIEVDRSELVAGYLGQTAIKTAEVVASAEGGVLFIDEAYSLSSADDQYGQEAVDTLVKEMEDKREDLVVIVAGYPAPMATFIDQNPGLSSRFRTEITFDDYSDDELVDIFSLLAGDSDYDITDACEKRFRMILGITPRGSTFGNGRFARNCLEAAIGRHAWRLRDVEEPTLDQLRQLLPEDLDENDGEDVPSDADADRPAQQAHPLEPDADTPVPAAPTEPEPEDHDQDQEQHDQDQEQADDGYPWWASEPGADDAEGGPVPQERVIDEDGVNKDTVNKDTRRG